MEQGNMKLTNKYLKNVIVEAWDKHYSYIKSTHEVKCEVYF